MAMIIVINLVTGKSVKAVISTDLKVSETTYRCFVIPLQTNVAPFYFCYDNTSNFILNNCKNVIKYNNRFQTFETTINVSLLIP